LALKKTRTIIPIIGDGELEMNNANYFQIKKGFRFESSETLDLFANCLYKKKPHLCGLAPPAGQYYFISFS
jgi:hypothetical protein